MCHIENVFNDEKKKFLTKIFKLNYAHCNFIVLLQVVSSLQQ